MKNKNVYYQPILSDEEWYKHKDFGTKHVFRSFKKCKKRFPTFEIGAYSHNDLGDGVIFVDSDIYLTCDKCGKVKHYKYEEDLFLDGKFFGLEDHTTVCKKCLK